MNSKEIKKAVSVYYPALALDAVIGLETRTELDEILGWSVFLSFSASSAGGVAAFLKLPWPADNGVVRFLTVQHSLFLGIFLMTFSLWLVAMAIKSFYDSYYFYGLKTSFPEMGMANEKVLMTFESATILRSGISMNDITKAFIFSKLGSDSLRRLGLGGRDLTQFVSSRQFTVDFSEFSASLKVTNEFVVIGDIATSVVNCDDGFARFLAIHEVTIKDLVGSISWSERLERKFQLGKRFWGRDFLGRIKGLGKDWSYGGAFALEKFAHDITERELAELDGFEQENEFNLLEAVLARKGEANAILVAEEGAGAMDIIFALGTRINRGNVLPSLQHKRIFLFDSNAFVASFKDKMKFEETLLHILNQSISAGNVILVINDLPSFVENTKSIGSDLIALIDPFLSSSDFQVIAVANPSAFHRFLESDGKILHRFEKILIKDASEDSIVKMLEDNALIEESKSKIFFTYQSLAAIEEGARRYFGDSVTSDKALHLFSELVPSVLTKKKKVIVRQDVLAFISQKTGIPVGEIGVAERDKLLNLESILHKRIVGQDEAIKAISNSIRRARSDIENPERPLGSFLFLGPTGVGKTETTKALAAIFFGNEESIIRLDMSEYQSADSLNRLIGSFGDGKAGVLSSKLREQSYGILLLDEFEKTSLEVMNLFLQILDEGFFSDMTGKKVNTRNLIIIATSNAGSDLIRNLMSEGKGLQENKDKIVNEIINRGIFKPELLNRFDGVILFHPLSSEDLSKISSLMLKKLQKRLAEKGIDLIINEALHKVVVSAGTDQQFGARPMNRAIQEKIEQVIAKKMISGEARSGTRLELHEEDLV